MSLELSPRWKPQGLVAEEMLSLRVRNVHPPGGRRPGDRPAARDREAAHPALEVAERWMPGTSGGRDHEQHTEGPKSSRPTKEPEEAGTWICSALSAPEPAEDCSPLAGVNRPGPPVGPGDAAPAPGDLRKPLRPPPFQLPLPLPETRGGCPEDPEGFHGGSPAFHSQGHSRADRLDVQRLCSSFEPPSQTIVASCYPTAQ
jgi:hypothetical protein